MRRAKYIFGLLAIAVASGAALLASPAAAYPGLGEYTLKACDTTYVTPRGFGTWEAPYGTDIGSWEITPRCPSDVEFNSKNATYAGNTWRGFEFPEGNSPNNTIKAVRFSLKGSDGSDGNLEQGVTICSPQKCSDPVMPSGPSVIAPEPKVLTTADFPPGSNVVRVVGRCKSGLTCTKARSLHVQDLEIDFADTVKPTIAFSDYVKDATRVQLEWYSPNEGSIWNNKKNRRIDVDAADAESGVELVEYRFLQPLGAGTFGYQGYWWEPNMICGTAGQKIIGYLCPKRWQEEFGFSSYANLNNYGLRNGLNGLRVTAYDAAGNTAVTETRQFLLDSVAPTLKLNEDDYDGGKLWRPGNPFRVSWQNTGETGESDRDSGLAGAHWSLKNYSTGAIVSGHEGDELGEVSSFNDVTVPGNGLWNVAVTTIDNAGNESAVHTMTVGMDSTVLEPPRIDPIADVGAPGLKTGIAFTWKQPINVGSAPSGICDYAMSVDQNPTADPGTEGGIDREALSALLPSPLNNGQNYLHMRAINCAGIPGKISDVPFDVDASPPVIALSKPGPGGWYSDKYPLSAWLTAGADAGTTMSLAFEGGSQSMKPAVQLDAPLTEGAHTLTVLAKDALGNTSTLVSQVQIDGAEPTVELVPQSVATPTLVRANVTDSGSGVTEAYLQYRSAGTPTWHSFGNTVHPEGGAVPSVELGDHIPDEQLADGVYEIQAVARDNAGHLTTSSPGATLALPLRRAPQLTAGFESVVALKTCKKHSAAGKCSKSITKKSVKSRDFTLVAAGKGALVTGTLIGASGLPLGNKQVQIYELVIGQLRKQVATVPTNAKGEYAFRIIPGPSRRVTARFAGDETNFVAESTVRFLATPKISLAIRKSAKSAATKVAFSGQVTAPGASIPGTGLKIEIQYRLRGSKKLFAAAGTSDSAGRFAVTVSFPPTKQPLRVSVRVAVPWFGGWPYEPGYSNTESFVVR